MKKIIVMAIATVLTGSVHAGSFSPSADANAKAYGGKAYGFGGTGIAQQGQKQGQAQGQLQGQLQGQGQKQSSSNWNLNGNSNRNDNSNANFNANSNSNRNANMNANTNKNKAVGVGISGAASFSGSSAKSSNYGTVTNDIYIEGDEAEEIPVNTAYAPALTAAAGTCLGSASVGLQGPGFGFSGGSTTLDEGCEVRKNSMLLKGMGYPEAAITYICNSDAGMAKALGDNCPKDAEVPDEEPKLSSNEQHPAHFLGF